MRAVTDTDVEHRFVDVGPDAEGQQLTLHVALAGPATGTFGAGSRPDQLVPIHAETMLIWGMDDHALGPNCLLGLEPHVPHLRIERIPDASHWVAQDAPETVNALLLNFLE